MRDHDERKGDAVPLSEDEQRILREIEERLYETDPRLAKDVSSTTVHSAALRRIRWAVLGMIVAIALTIYFLSVHYLLAFAAFLVAFAMGAVAEAGVRALGPDGVRELLGRLAGLTGADRLVDSDDTEDVESD